MNRLSRIFLLCGLAAACGLSASPARADSLSLSYTGTLASPTSTFALEFALSGSGTQQLDFQTWGFGGGTNANGVAIAPGGFDALLALFSGTGSGAQLINGSADNQSNFASFAGCPPAGTVNFSNGDAVCGDVNLAAALAPGVYTLVLSDANNVANALSDDGTLGEGYTDLTGGVFQTCDTNTSGTACITPNANWAFDVTDQTGANLASVPEPGSLALWAGGLLCLSLLVLADRFQRRTS